MKKSVPGSQSDCVIQQLWTQSQTVWMNTGQIFTSGENQSAGHWLRRCQILLCYSMLPPLGELGYCTVTNATAKPVMIKNVVITNDQLLSVLVWDVWVFDEHQPKQNVFLISTLSSVQYFTCPGTQDKFLNRARGQSMTTLTTGKIL